jgi:hypothetical protein
MDVENLDALTPAELEALLEQALNPRVPVEVLYAVLERIGAGAQVPTQPHAQVPPRGAATDRAVRPERPRPPTAPTSAQPQMPQMQMPQMPATPPTSQASQVPPTNGMPGMPGPGPAPGPNPNTQQTTVIPVVPSGPGPSNAAAPTAVIPVVPSKPQSNPPNVQPSVVSSAVPPSRGAHAPSRRPGTVNPESGR